MMETGWLKAKIIVSRDDIGETKLLRDAGVPNDTSVIAIVPNNTFPTNKNSECAWQVYADNTAKLISVEMVESRDAPVPASPLELSTGSLSLTTDLSLYMSETIRMLHEFKNREIVWIQPMKSHPVQEVWLSHTHDCEENLIKQFLDQIHQRSKESKIIVRINGKLQFDLKSRSHDPASAYHTQEIWFEVLQVVPIAQGHLTEDSKIIVGSPSDDIESQCCHSDDDSDDDGGLTYDPQNRFIYSDNETDDDDDNTRDLLSLLPSRLQPRQRLLSASEIRRSSVVTIGNNWHIFKCIPLYNYPVEKNFILLPKSVRERLGCYGLENLIISPVESSHLHIDLGTSFVAIVEDFKEKSDQRSVIYVHPEVYFNLFPFPVNHVTTCHSIQAEVYRPGVTGNNEPFVRYKTITVTPVSSRSYNNNCTVSPDVLLRRYFKRDNEMFLGMNYVFSILTEFGVMYFKVVATDPMAPLGSVGLSTSVILKTPAESSFVPDCDHLSTRSPSYWIDHYPKGLYQYYEQLLSFCLPVYERKHPRQMCVLISGPTGVGKTAVARAVARACRVHLLPFNCHEFVGDHIPNILKRMSNAVAEAKRCAPSLLLLRKLHALCKEKEPSREDPRIAQGFDKMVKQLVQHNADSKYPVMMVGTSYRPQILPQRISGCFIHEVVMITPNLQERAEILEGLSKDMITAPDVDFADISLKTSGLLLGDFVAMTMHASQAATGEAMQHCFPSGMAGSCDQLSIAIAGATVTQKHYDKAVKIIQEAHNDAIGAPKVPTVRWKDVGGLDVAKSEILDTIQLPLQHPEMFTKGLRRSGILLYGAPGTGKTLLAKAVASECALNFLSVKGPELINMYVGQSEQNIREVFMRAKSATPCVIFFDEIDSLAPNRGKSGDSGGVMDRIVSQLLAELDGLQSNEDIFIIGATNRPDLLDPSLLRPGRFDRLVYLDIADDVNSKVLILQALTRRIRLQDDVSLESVAKACPSNTTGADLYGLCNEATKVSLRHTINSLEAKGLTDDDWIPPLLVTNDDFLTAVSELKPSVSKTELESYRNLRHTINSNLEAKGSRDEKLTLPLSVSDDTSEIKPSVSDAELEKYRNLRHTINSSVEAKGSSDEKLTLPLSVSDDTSEIKPSVSEAELEKYHNLHHDVTNSLKDKGLIEDNLTQPLPVTSDDVNELMQSVSLSDPELDNQCS